MTWTSPSSSMMYSLPSPITGEPEKPRPSRSRQWISPVATSAHETTPLSLKMNNKPFWATSVGTYEAFALIV